ncbi:hypothetical protein PanWU01x14_083670, partial [Parasponia andersonii]
MEDPREGETEELLPTKHAAASAQTCRPASLSGRQRSYRWWSCLERSSDGGARAP